MYNKKINAQSAPQLIGKVPPMIEYVFDKPSSSFIRQSFQKFQPKLSKATRHISQIAIQDLSTRKGD
jgi:hypothetical protein